jgi:hypothetical protein
MFPNPVKGEFDMSTIRATIRSGRIVTDKPVLLPDGTEFFIELPFTTANFDPSEIRFMTEDEQSDDPETIRKWIDELRSIPPVPDTPEQAANRAAWKEKMRDFNLSAMQKQFEENSR